MRKKPKEKDEAVLDRYALIRKEMEQDLANTSAIVSGKRKKRGIEIKSTPADEIEKTAGGIKGTNRAIRKTRAEDAFDLRCKGWSFQKIASELGVSVGTIYNDMERELAKQDDRLEVKSDKLRRVELRRLDSALEELMSAYTTLKKKKKGLNRLMYMNEVADYVDAMIKIMDRRARYIPGANAPNEIKSTGLFGSEDFVEKILQAQEDLLIKFRRFAGEDPLTALTPEDRIKKEKDMQQTLKMASLINPQAVGGTLTSEGRESFNLKDYEGPAQ